ncbi:PBP1A family penicillin-binding protein [Marivita sp. GX14005]|uniref:transglycosylase domain-containing protein n=1 Tax=Marivita sp. GX14005 TaxID=2942276 RepID=UPI002018F36E|nr:PBP1A family penicillin-binding protein [Marivita sp. GX14005]MCL3881346.1 PBP1A family penicillin-binding protein [Marivita sp. GX14005]
MADKRRNTGRLVADRRYPAKSAKPAKPRKRAKPRRAAPARRKPARGGILGFFGRIIRWILAFFFRLFWRFALVVSLIVAGMVFYTYTTLPDASAALDGRSRGSVQLLDRNGVAFAWRGDQFGGVVTADSVSPHLRNAVVATEDKRFYSHFGLSPRGIASAVRINLSEGRGPLSGHGGSTITQQTAKLLCLGVKYDPKKWKNEAEYVSDCRRGSLLRKGKEAIYALAMEAKYSKDEILSIYLNRAYMGGGAYGASAASERYFSKPAAALNPQEAAMIAGLLTAPSSLAPTSNLERSQARAATVLRLMNEQGYLTDAQTRTAQANPATLSEEAERKTGGYFADWVMQSGPDFFTRDTTEDVIISTTLDQRIQRAAEAAIKTVFDNKVSPGSKAQAAIVVMSADGAVRAMVGGRKTNVSGVFNRATQAKRQTGSAFKPFVYATALELGYGPYDTVEDAPFCMNIPGSGQWCPENYARAYNGPVTLTEALKRSLNVPAVKISESVGRDLVRQVSEDFGIDSALTDTPALALGASEASLLEMTGAYAGILNGGSSVTPYGLRELRLKGEETATMGAGGGIGERVIREDAARQLIWMMEKVVSEGTGRRAALPDRQAAGKTGTTQAARDAWFIGFTADYVAGVWMGYDDNTPLTGVTGSGLPAEIWHEAMVRIHDGLPVRPLPMIAPQASRPAPAPQPAAPQRQPQSGNPLENAVNQILRDIFGGN